MSPRQPYEMIYAPVIKAHLKTIEPKYNSLIRENIAGQLRYEADIETRNRKPLKRPIIFDAQWELRFGPDNRFRVFYKVSREHNRVEILAIGIKQGNRLYVGGQEYE